MADGGGGDLLSGAIGAVIGAVLGAVIGGAMTWRVARDQHRTDARNRVAESVEEWVRAIHEFYSADAPGLQMRSDVSLRAHMIQKDLSVRKALGAKVFDNEYQGLLIKLFDLTKTEPRELSKEQRQKVCEDANRIGSDCARLLRPQH